MYIDNFMNLFGTVLNHAQEAAGDSQITIMQAGGMIVTWLIYSAIMYKLFQKADHPEPIKAFIPFYNYYEAFRITAGTGWYCLLLFIPFNLPNIVGQIMLAVFVGRAFRKSTLYKLGMFFFPIIFYGIMALNEGDRFFGINGFGHTPAEPGSQTVDFETVTHTAQAEAPEHSAEAASDYTPMAEPTVMDVEETEITIE